MHTKDFKRKYTGICSLIEMHKKNRMDFWMNRGLEKYLDTSQSK